MDITKKYTIRTKETNILMAFSYDLDGYLTSFEIEEGRLTRKLHNWLFQLGHFPYKESDINSWRGIKNIEMSEQEPDLSFDTFWDAYGYKVKGAVAKKAWEKLSKLDRMKAIRFIKTYKGFLARKNGRQQTANPATYLNQRYWDDEGYKSN